MSAFWGYVACIDIPPSRRPCQYGHITQEHTGMLFWCHFRIELNLLKQRHETSVWGPRLDLRELGTKYSMYAH